jgi:alcohol dehydrogenase class IV
VTSLMALESVKLLRESLPRVVADPSTAKDRSAVLYGAFLAGMAVASTGIALQHKLAHTVAACCNLPHADTHAILLPHTVAYNLGALNKDITERLGLALVGHSDASVDDIVLALGKLLRTLGVRCALKDLGMDESDIDRTAATAMERPYWNPRSLEREKIREIIRRAWAGELARVDL